MAQALALVPGTSRSGITITAGTFAWLQASGCCAIFFPVVRPGYFACDALQRCGPGARRRAPVAWGELALGVVVSAVVAYVSIDFFMRVVSRIGLAPFAIYRLLLAAVILYVMA